MNNKRNRKESPGEMKEHESVNKKLIPNESAENLSSDFYKTLNETIEIYDETLKELKDR